VSGTALAVVLSTSAGFAGAIQAAVMGELGERVGIVPAVAFSAVVTVVIGVTALVLSKRSLSGLGEVVHEPPWLWIGGALSLFIILSITVGPPRIGTTATLGMVVGGTLFMGAVIDRFGLFGLDRIALTWPRVLGLVLFAAGAALSLHRS
jgi:transporter family-2 protein